MTEQAPGPAGALSALADLLRASPAAVVADLASDADVATRLAAPDHPLLVVVGGSTGVGKSTVVNSLVGRRASPAGVLRPTTRTPVLLHHPDDAAWFTDPQALVRSEVDVVSDPAVPGGIALLDSPDVDSVEEHNRLLASALADLADLWLVVTSAARYADAVPWHLLRRTVRRHAATAVVLNRVDALAAAEVSTHLASLMTSEGLGDSPLVVISEHPGSNGLLPAEAMAGLRGLLGALSRSTQVQAALRRRRLAIAVDDLRQQVLAVVADDSDWADEVRSVLADLAPGDDTTPVP